MNISAYSLSTTCHQIKSEALAYYYRNNFFRLELADPERLPTRLAEDDGQQYKLLCAHMGRVQKLQLEMKVVNSRFYDVEQKEQLAWVCDALVWAKKGEKEGKTGSRTEGREVSKKLLKGLVVLDRQQVSGFRPSEFRNMEIAHIVSILEPLRGRVGGLMVFDQVIPFV